tara:strand:+ start:2707 stop:3105 length:399 start_codon:yes stop_codon:yes gene_type:complete
MRVIIESPYGGDDNKKEQNRRYAQRCLDDSINKKESPLAFHLLYTQVLDDDDPVKRTEGIELSKDWYKYAEKVVVYVDFGITNGMQEGIDLSMKLGLPIEMRSIANEGLGYTNKGFRTYWSGQGRSARGYVD